MCGVAALRQLPVASCKLHKAAVPTVGVLQAGAFGGAKSSTLAAGHGSRLLMYLAGTWPFTSSADGIAVENLPKGHISLADRIATRSKDNDPALAVWWQQTASHASTPGTAAAAQTAPSAGLSVH